MKNRIAATSQHKAARIAGFMFLFCMVAAVFAELYVRSSFIVSGNAAETASNIIASEHLFRIGLASALFNCTGVVILLLALYILLKPVNKHLAMLGAFWRLGEAFILGINSLNSFIVLELLIGADYLAVFETAQQHSLAYLFISAYGPGTFVAMIFFSLGSIVFNYLFFKSRYIPRVLAAWGLFASIAALIGSFAILLSLPIAELAFPFAFIPIFIDEVCLALWLLYKGVNIQSYSAA